MKKFNEDKSQNSSLEIHIANILAENGSVFPENEEELIKILDAISKEEIKIPSGLDDQSRIYKLSERKYLKKDLRTDNSDYSLAARQGGKISQETLNKIIEKRTENGKKRDQE